MDHRQRRAGQRIGQIGVEAAHLRRQQHALVDKRPAGKRCHVEIGQTRQIALQRLGFQRVLGLLPDREQLALERILILHIRSARDDRLRDDGHRFEHRHAQPGRVHGHVAPADQHLPLDPDEPLEPGDRRLSARLVARQEAHRHRIIARPGQTDARLIRPVAEQGIGNLDKTAGAVAHQRIGADTAAMIEIGENAEALRDDRVGRLVPYMRDKAHPARVMLVAGVI